MNTKASTVDPIEDNDNDGPPAPKVVSPRPPMVRRLSSGARAVTTPSMRRALEEEFISFVSTLRSENDPFETDCASLGSSPNKTTVSVPSAPLCNVTDKPWRRGPVMKQRMFGESCAKGMNSEDDCDDASEVGGSATDRGSIMEKLDYTLGGIIEDFAEASDWIGIVEVDQDNDYHPDESNSDRTISVGVVGDTSFHRYRSRQWAKFIIASFYGILILGAIIGVTLGVTLLVQNQNYHPNGPGHTGNLQVTYQAPEQQQHLLDMAEQVVVACSESKLNDDASDCQHLCQHSSCCFERGGYSCEDDEEKDCAVYAGCGALVQELDDDTAVDA